MPRNTLKGMRAIAEKHGVEPGEYLLSRLAHLVQEEKHDHAEQLALDLLPYTQRKMAAQPVEAVEDAARAGRLVITVGANDAG